MAQQNVPQPAVTRIAPIPGHPLVVAVKAEASELVVRTAAAWARALGVGLFLAYVDPSRTVVRECPDGSVIHTELDPDLPDECWRDKDAALRARLAELLADAGVDWQFRYLAGRADRALTHLARTVDASAFVVGGHGSGRRRGPRDFLNDSLPARLTVHQHRPGLVVPQSVVDWHDRAPWA